MLDHLVAVLPGLRAKTEPVKVYFGWPGSGPNAVPRDATPPYGMAEPLAEGDGRDRWEVAPVFRLHWWAKSYGEAERLRSIGFAHLHGRKAGSSGQMLSGIYSRVGGDWTVEDDGAVHSAETYEVSAGDKAWMEAQLG